MRSVNQEHRLRSTMCEVARRLYQRGLVAACDGNLSCRLDGSRVLCTPSRMCKGYLQPDDLAVVDLEGRQLAGPRPHTSEILLHLEIYKGLPAAQAVAHCHPPHATAFAVTREDIPTGILSEIEILVGPVPRAPYELPGTPQFAASVRPFLGAANTVLLSHHGTVSWADSLERACDQTEMLDAYCNVLILARQLGPVQRLPDERLRELAALRQRYLRG
jgi:L-fuculose-phosphate aldolase